MRIAQREYSACPTGQPEFRHSTSRNSTTKASIETASNWLLFLALRCRRLQAGNTVRLWVDFDPTKLLGKGLTPLDVVNAVNAQNPDTSRGNGENGQQYVVRTNATPESIDDLNNIPVKVMNGATMFVKNVGRVHDGWPV
jgi:hypothetical protein